MSNIAIQLTHISKKFDIRSERTTSGKDSFYYRFLERLKLKTQKEFWALKDISIEIMEGESVGIIGMNGAGKTTLLKILSDILRPTSGEVRIRGQLAAILEIGVGFHQELSGRENIYLYGKMLGFSNFQIKSKFDEIVEFSEITNFIDTPIKHYSSGMIMRLGFAIIALLETDIILLDEMLAVGDVHFRTKCLNKILEMKNNNRTIVIVGHDMNQIANYCDKLFLLDKGYLIDSGPPKSIIDKYQQILLQYEDSISDDSWNEYRRSNEQSFQENLKNLKTRFTFDNILFPIKSDSFKLHSIEITSSGDQIADKTQEFSIDEEIQVHVKAEYFEGKSDFCFFISDMMNNRLFGDTVFKNKTEYPIMAGFYDFKWIIPPNCLNEGVYKLGIILGNEKDQPIFSMMELLVFATVNKESPINDFALYMPMKPKFQFTFNLIGN